MSKPLLHLTVSHKDSALRLVEAAIHHARSDDYDCAITLAAAAEGQLPDTDAPYIYNDLRANGEAKDLDLNAVINWLKHPIAPDQIAIGDFEVAITILRAISKFVAVYHQASALMNEFEDWARRHYGLQPRGGANNPPFPAKK